MLNIRKFFNGLRIYPKVTSGVDAQGEMDVTSGNGKINYHNGTTASPVVTETHASQGANRLQNKDLDDDSVRFVDSADTTKRVEFETSGNTTGVTTTIATNSTVNETINLPTGGGTVITRTSVDQGANRLQNKDLDDDSVKFVDSGDTTKALEFEVAGSATGTTTTIASASTVSRTITLPDADATLISRTSVDQGADRLQNKDLDDDSVKFVDSADTSKAIEFEAAGSSTATTTTIASASTASRTLTLPNVTDTLVSRTSADQGANRLRNKDLNDGDVVFVDSADTTKKLLFDVGGTTGTIMNVVTQQTVTRTLNLPDADDTLVGRNTTDTFTNKNFNQDVVASTSGTRDVGTSAVNFRNAYLSSFVDSGQISTPANPASNRDRLYFKSDNNLYSLDSTGNEKLIGSGSSLSLNFIGMNSSFQPVNTNDKDAEASVGNWAAYADPASPIPTDMTGGSPTVTIARTTTAGEVLNGAGSFEVVKDAADRQGEGVSVIANIPPGYRGKPAAIVVPFKVISGSLAAGDLKVYIYDVTNSQVITPFNNDVVYTSTIRCTFDVPSNCSQIRFGFHFASTSTNAVDFTFDDVFVGPQDVSFGPPMSDWIDESSRFTVTGGGTVTNLKIFTKRDGDSLFIRGNWTCGTVVATTASLNLVDYRIDSNKLPTDTNGSSLGFSTTLNSVTSNIFSADNERVAFYDGSTVDKIFFAYQVGTTGYQKALGNVIWVTNEEVTVDFSIPISGWSSSVVTQNSSLFRISDVLANGTRVTGTPPVALGEYRSYLRNAGAVTFTEVNGAPNIPPSSDDGITIYTATNNATGDANGEPSRYEIFVGKNKQWRIDWFNDAGRTGFINASAAEFGTTTFGYVWNYDPTTGIFTVIKCTSGGNNYSTGTLGNGNDGGTSPIRFDVTISENVVPVQIQSNRSEVLATQGNGTGAVNTVIRRFLTVDINTGNAITYADSANDGASFTINEDGIYTISYSDIVVAGSINFGISINSNQLTTGIASITRANCVGLNAISATGSTQNQSYTLILRNGDVIRPHGEASGNYGTTGNEVRFRIVKVAN